MITCCICGERKKENTAKSLNIKVVTSIFQAENNVLQAMIDSMEKAVGEIIFDKPVAVAYSNVTAR